MAMNYHNDAREIPSPPSGPSGERGRQGQAQNSKLKAQRKFQITSAKVGCPFLELS